MTPVRLKRQILLYEPDSPAASPLETGLVREGFVIERASDPGQLEDYCVQRWYHLLLLRWPWPEQDSDQQALLSFLDRLPPDPPRLVSITAPQHADWKRVTALYHLLQDRQIAFLADRGQVFSDELLERIQRLLSQAMPDQPDVRTSPDGRISLPVLAGLLDPDLRGVMAGYRIDELGDLLRRHFHRASHLFPRKVVWSRDGELALLLDLFLPTQDLSELRLVRIKFTHPALETNFANDLIGLVLHQTSRTNHFILADYTLEGAPALEELINLDELADGPVLPDLSLPLASFFNRQRRNQGGGTELPDLGSLFIQLNGLPARERLPAQVARVLQDLPQQVRRSGMSLERSGDSWILHLNARTFTLPPLENRLAAFLSTALPGPTGRHPHPLRLEYLLTADSHQMTWLAAGGLVTAPAGYAAVQLEADLCLHPHPGRSLESCLDQVGQVYVPDQWDIFPGLPAGLAATLATLRQGAQLAEAHRPLYLAGLLFHALGQLQPRPRQETDLAGTLVSLVALPLLLDCLVALRGNAARTASLVWEEARHCVLLDGEVLELSPQGRDLLRRFLDLGESGGWLSYEQLTEVLVNKTQGDYRQNAQKAVSRLVEKLEKAHPDLEWFTNRDGGYEFHPIPRQKAL